MSTTNIPTYSDNDDDDDANNDSATQPLLLQSTTSTSSTKAGNGSTAAKIKLPTSIIVPISKSTSAKPNQTNNCNENRVCARLTHFMNVRFNRSEHNNRRSHRDRWSRINIGLFAISFISVIYLCVSLNLNVDSKPTPQMIVDVPPVDPDLIGTRGTFEITFETNEQNNHFNIFNFFF